MPGKSFELDANISSRTLNISSSFITGDSCLGQSCLSGVYSELFW